MSDITETSAALLKELQRLSTSDGSIQAIDKELLDAAYVGIVRSYDSKNGGFGNAPKFPPAMTLEFLLRTFVRTGKPDALDMVRQTVEKMANGGMYDQLGGGFHRYSTDAKWLVPHFEKMLYDNALLSRLYLHYFQVSKDSLARTTTEGILDYVLREMTSPEGGFYSTQDADSEGHEGKFFVWDIEEVRSLLGEKDGEIFCEYYDISPSGNFEGKNIPNVVKSLDEVAQKAGMSVAEAQKSLDESRQKLFTVRERRVKPDRDEKILGAWNGLMLASFSEAGVVLDRTDYLDAARKNADFILTKLKRDGLLLRTYKDGVSKFNAYLEDYAFISEGLLTLYEVTAEARWLDESLMLTERMVEEFWDETNGGFFFTGKSHEKLIVRSKDYFDNATPSGNSVAANVLLRLGLLTNNEKYRNLAIAVFREIADSARKYASGFGYALSAMDFHLSTPKEVAIVGTNAASLAGFLRATWQSYLPNKVVAGAIAGTGDSTTIVALLENRGLVSDKTTAYICENYTCQQPITDLAAFTKELASN